MSEPSIKKNLLLSTLYQVLQIIVPLITAPYLSRVLTADGIGIYSFTNSIQMYFALFASLGTVSYGTREIARNRYDDNTRSKIFWEIELLTVITSVVSLLVYGVFVFNVEQYRICYLILSINIVAVIFDISWLYTGMEQMKYTIGPNCIFRIAGVIAILTFVKSREDLLKYILIMVLITLLSNASMWIYLPKYIKRVRFRSLRIKNHFKETLIYFIPTIAISVYAILDKTLIGLITENTNENGYYEQATKIINLAKSLTFSSLNTILGSRISLLFAEKRIDEIKERIEKSIDYIAFMGVGICFGIIGTAPRFVPLFFGEGYEPVVQLLYLLSPIILIIGVSNCLGSQYYNPVGLRALSAKFIIIGAVANLIMNIVLIPKYSSSGAVIASILAELIISILYLKFCNGFVHFSVLLKHGWKKVISGLIMLVAIRLIGSAFVDDLSAVIIEIVVGVSVYGLVLLMLNDSFVMFGIKMIKQRGNRE